ncbi:MAG TPA: RluA family pseudouridine synthase [Candidatus Acidoferrum sp.]|nr:RluA family pseudouridine synthase [Candidatus Acidoferrum sp.]
MAKPNFIELREGKVFHRFSILYEDRNVLAIDKPRHWMLVPFTWQRTNRNLQAALTSSIAAGDFWASSRSLKFLRFVHRLDADTTGILLFAKSAGAARALGDLFETRQIEKRYLAVVQGLPKQREWKCDAAIDPDPDHVGSMKLSRDGKEAETHFRLIETRGERSLIEARPHTGRTHQIRLHLKAAHLPVLGDDLYGRRSEIPLALRAVEINYRDVFTRKPIRIRASEDEFLQEYGFGIQ